MSHTIRQTNHLAATDVEWHQRHSQKSSEAGLLAVLRGVSVSWRSVHCYPGQVNLPNANKEINTFLWMEMVDAPVLLASKVVAFEVLRPSQARFPILQLEVPFLRPVLLRPVKEWALILRNNLSTHLSLFLQRSPAIQIRLWLSFGEIQCLRPLGASEQFQLLPMALLPSRSLAARRLCSGSSLALPFSMPPPSLALLNWCLLPAIYALRSGGWAVGLQHYVVFHLLSCLTMLKTFELRISVPFLPNLPLTLLVYCNCLVMPFVRSRHCCSLFFICRSLLWCWSTWLRCDLLLAFFLALELSRDALVCRWLCAEMVGRLRRLFLAISDDIQPRDLATRWCQYFQGLVYICILTGLSDEPNPGTNHYQRCPSWYVPDGRRILPSRSGYGPSPILSLLRAKHRSNKRHRQCVRVIISESYLYTCIRHHLWGYCTQTPLSCLWPWCAVERIERRFWTTKDMA